MNDPEFRELVKKALFTLFIVLLFAIPLFFIFKNKIVNMDTKVLSFIKNGKTGFIYITEDKCSKCNTIKKELDKKEIKYILLNRNQDKNYKEILNRLGVKESNLDTPILMYIKKGKLKSYIVNISKEDLNKYLKNYKSME